jgi:hypothetical protein
MKGHPMQHIVVKIPEIDSFLQEVEADKLMLSRNMVRGQVEYRNVGPWIHSSVVLSAIIGSGLLLCEQKCGVEMEGEKAIKKAFELLDTAKTRLSEMKVEVRDGRFSLSEKAGV